MKVSFPQIKHRSVSSQTLSRGGRQIKVRRFGGMMLTRKNGTDRRRTCLKSYLQGEIDGMRIGQIWKIRATE